MDLYIHSSILLHGVVHNYLSTGTTLLSIFYNFFCSCVRFSVRAFIINEKSYFRDLISHSAVSYIGAVECVSPVDKHRPRGIRRVAVGNCSLSLSGKRLDWPGVGDLELGRATVTSVFQTSEDIHRNRKMKTVYSV
jgi:hypothetical protein